MQLALANSLSEVASQIGKRNATVTLLRDGLYRQCEAYMNGLIDEVTYEQIANKYVNAMVTLLAIEELTGDGGAERVQKVGGNGSVTATTNVNVNVKPPTAPESAEPPEEGQDEGAPAETAGTEASDDAAGSEATPEETAGGDTPAEDEASSEESGSTPSTSEGAAAAPAPVVGTIVTGSEATIPAYVASAVQAMVLEFQRKDTKDYCLIQMRRLIDLNIKTITVLLQKDSPFDQLAKLCAVVFVTERIAIEGSLASSAPAESTGTGEPQSEVEPPQPEPGAEPDGGAREELQNLLKSF